MLWAKQSAAATLIVGPVLDSAGAEYASAVIGDLSLSKNGATLTALASAATLTYIANGMYTLVLTTGNTDTLGRAQISCNKSTYQMPACELMVLPATVFDALVTNATNTTGGLPAATGTLSAVAGYVGSTGAAVNGTNANTLSSHDPGATLGTGTSTLTQTQVSGGAYALNSSSFAFNAALDLTTTQKTSVTTAATAATPTAAAVTGAVGSVTGAVGSVTGSVGSVATGGIVAASFATDSIAAAAVKADAVTKIQSGLALAAAAPSWYAAPVDVSANVTAIKAKTDQLTFTVALHVDATASVALSQGDIDSIAAGIEAAVGEDILAIKAKTDLLGTIPLAYRSPYDPVANLVKITRGCDYKASDGRSIDLPWATPASMDGAIPTLRLPGVSITGVFTGTGTETVKTARYEPTAAQTLLASTGPFTQRAVQADGDTIEGPSGSVIVE